MPSKKQKTFLLKFRFWTKLLVRQKINRTKLLVGHNFSHPPPPPPPKKKFSHFCPTLFCDYFNIIQFCLQVLKMTDERDLRKSKVIF